MYSALSSPRLARMSTELEFLDSRRRLDLCFGGEASVGSLVATHLMKKMIMMMVSMMMVDDDDDDDDDDDAHQRPASESGSGVLLLHLPSPWRPRL